jgi:hypothetical protein
MKRIKLSITLILVLMCLAMSACTGVEPVAEKPPLEPTEPPFENTEPEKYQTYVTHNTPAGVVRFFIARNGDNWRIDSDVDGPNRTASMRIDGKDYVLDLASGSYGEYTAGHGFDERQEMVREITYGLIAGKEIAVYEKTGEGYKFTDDKGREVIVRLSDHGRPLKKEIYRNAENGRGLDISVELMEFKLEPDPVHFVMPKDLKKVSMAEMKNILTKAR